MKNVSLSPSPGTFNVSDEEMENYYELLQRLNYERVLFQLPVIVILLVIMVVAIPGNIVVILVYRFTWRSKVACFFMTMLAAVDLLTALCIPFDIQDMLNPYLNAAPVACKIGRFLEVFAVVLSGNVLVCITFDRYFHIIYPLRRYTFQQAKSLTVVVTAIALSLSWPQLFLAGKRTVVTPVEGVLGEDCSFEDSFRNSIYTLLFQTLLAFNYVIGFSVAFIFYCRIFFVIWQRKRKTIGEQISKSSSKKNENRKKFSLPKFNLRDRMSSKSYTMNTETKETNIESKNISQKINIVTVNKNNTMSENSVNSTERSTNHSAVIDNQRSKSSKQRTGTTQFTKIMAIVTVAAIVSFSPYLLVNVFRNLGMFFRPGMSKTEDLVFEFCAKSFYINSFINPIIYSVMNPTFRSDAWKAITKIGRYCCFKR